MTAEYDTPKLQPIAFDFDAAPPIPANAVLSLSHKDVLGIVHSALDALDSEDRALNAVRRSVLEHVAAGKLAEALREAIIGAGRRGGS